MNNATTKTATTTSNNVLDDFVKRVNTIVEEREVWQATVFKDSNDALYDLLSKVYGLYEHTADNETLSAEAMAWLLAECANKNLKLTKKPTHLQLIVKYVFADGQVDSRRISSYVRVLAAAALSFEVTSAADVAEFIRRRGGIEEVRAEQAKNTLSPRKRAEQGKMLAVNYPTLASVEIAQIKSQLAMLQNDYVVLLGHVNTYGEVEVKHVCYSDSDNKKIITCRTAVNSALSNLYSNYQKNKKDVQKQLNAEKEAESNSAELASIKTATETETVKGEVVNG